MDKVPQPKTNGPILPEFQTLRNVISSAAEVEVGMVHMNGEVTIPIRIVLDKMGHPQGPTPIKTDNNTAEGFLNGTMRKKTSKGLDMKFHWMIDRIQQKKCWVYWERGIYNLVDYFTKHRPATIKS